MNTPSGTECAYYYEDFRRGSEIQECRADRAPGSAAWRPSDCRHCPVPGILAANGNPLLRLSVEIKPGVLGVGRRVEVTASCRLHGEITDAYVGCRVCNADADAILRGALG